MLPSTTGSTIIILQKCGTSLSEVYENRPYVSIDFEQGINKVRLIVACFLHLLPIEQYVSSITVDGIYWWSCLKNACIYRRKLSIHITFPYFTYFHCKMYNFPLPPFVKTAVNCLSELCLWERIHMVSFPGARSIVMCPRNALW